MVVTETFKKYRTLSRCMSPLALYVYIYSTLTDYSSTSMAYYGEHTMIHLLYTVIRMHNITTHTHTHTQINTLYTCCFDTDIYIFTILQSGIIYILLCSRSSFTNHNANTYKTGLVACMTAIKSDVDSVVSTSTMHSPCSANLCRCKN